MHIATYMESLNPWQLKRYTCVLRTLKAHFLVTVKYRYTWIQFHTKNSFSTRPRMQILGSKTAFEMTN